MMIVHFPMAFLIGAFLFDVAAVLGGPVPWAIGGYLLVAGLFAGMIAALPGIVDFMMSVRPAGGRPVATAIRHAILSMGSLIAFAGASFLRGELTAAPAATALWVEFVGVVLLATSALLGGNLVVRDLVGVND
jgi:uncharacterized membrane protein